MVPQSFFHQFVNSLVRDVIDASPEDPNFRETGRRVQGAFLELLSGHSLEARDEVKKHLSVTFPTDHDEMIVIRGVQSAGVCPHHLLPVLYTIHFAYIPSKVALGLSKVPRVIKLMSARAELQEDITSSLADLFFENVDLQPRGVAIVVQGFHSCMAIRGTREHSALTITSAMRGCFLDSADSSKSEFYDNLRLGGSVTWSG